MLFGNANRILGWFGILCLCLKLVLEDLLVFQLLVVLILKQDVCKRLFEIWILCTWRLFHRQSILADVNLRLHFVVILLFLLSNITIILFRHLLLNIRLKLVDPDTIYIIVKVKIFDTLKRMIYPGDLGLFSAKVMIWQWRASLLLLTHRCAQVAYALILEHRSPSFIIVIVLS